jgi:hypothetical protein
VATGCCTSATTGARTGSPRTVRERGLADVEHEQAVAGARVSATVRTGVSAGASNTAVPNDGSRRLAEDLEPGFFRRKEKRPPPRCARILRLRRQ